MKVVVAPNAFKNSLSAEEAGKAIIAGLQDSELTAEFFNIPIADGGDGSLLILTHYLEGELFKIKVPGPVGAPVMARYAINKKRKLGIIELAEASGIRLVEVEDMNPWIANTAGTGKLIIDAVDKGCKEILLTVGGSATIDGGLGILKEMGVKFFTEENEFRPTGPCDFHKIERIDTSPALRKYGDVQFQILVDVENPLLGPEGAVNVFGSQKGLDQDEKELFETSFQHWSDLLSTATGKSPDFSMGGASGGVSAALHMVFGAELISGASYILELSGFDGCIKDADLVITTEGQIDRQTGMGKGPGLVAKRASENGVTIVGLCGQIEDDYNPEDSYFDVVLPINSKIYSLNIALSRTRVNLRYTARQVGNLLSALKR